MNYQDPPVYRAAYELTLAVTRFVKDCDNDYKGTLGILLQQEVLKLSVAVWHISDCEDKVKAIQEAINSCYLVRMILCLLLDISKIKIETSIVLNNKLDETAKQLAGWKKASVLK